MLKGAIKINHIFESITIHKLNYTKEVFNCRITLAFVYYSY